MSETTASRAHRRRSPAPRRESPDPLGDRVGPAHPDQGRKDGEAPAWAGGGLLRVFYFMGFTTARRPNDLVIEYEGLTVLVDPRSLEILDGTVVDYERGLRTGIQFKNPRVKRSCGCGDSFSL